MKRTFVASAVLAAGLLISACTQEDRPNYGFSLPEGDVENGQLVFMEMRCIECHVLAGAEFVGNEPRIERQNDILVEIGGSASDKVQTYEDLVTSIINPSHRIAEGYNLEDVTLNGESKMLNYNDVLTVNELVDLVAFLRNNYELRSVPLTIYPYYGQ